MKYFAYVIMIVSLGLGIFNATHINFSTPLQGDSIVALITVIASLCAIFLMLILLTSKRIEEKVKQGSKN
jgi:xanthine/uracil permease